jgi:hypothetical protein
VQEGGGVSGDGEAALRVGLDATTDKLAVFFFYAFLSCFRWIGLSRQQT